MSSRRKKIQLKVCLKPVSRGCKLSPRKNDVNILSPCCLKLRDLSISYVLSCSICSSFYIENIASSYFKMYRNLMK